MESKKEEPTSFTDAAQKKKKEVEEEESGTAGTPGAEDEDTGAQVSPIVKLQEVAVSSGEENEDAILDLKAKLYRYDKEGRQWKERGAGTVKLLKHKETGKVRLVMRQAKTLKICANHLVLPSISVQEHQGNDRSCVWHAADFADGELKEEMFAIRFSSVEICRAFREKITEVAESLGNEAGESEGASTAAGLLENLNVSSKDEEKHKAGESEGASTTADLLEKLSVVSKDEEKHKAGESEGASTTADLPESVASKDEEKHEGKEPPAGPETKDAGD